VCSISNYNPASTATSQFLQLNQEHMQQTMPNHHHNHTLNNQAGMKLFPNYTSTSNGTANGMVRSGSSGAGTGIESQYYHQHPNYPPQTLAPLRLSQDHFVSKSNTMNNLQKQKIYHNSNTEPELPIRDEIIANNYNNTKQSLDNLDECNQRLSNRHYH
jgi:hypothetical protein